MTLPKDDKPTSGSPPSNSRKEGNAGYCRHCGDHLQFKDAKFCPSCGKSIGDSSDNNTSSFIYEKPNVVSVLPYKSPGTAALIALIGGIFGLCGLGHMYVGKVGRGIGILIGGLVMFGLALLAFAGLAILGSIGLGFGIGCGLGYLVLFIWQIFEARSLAEIFNESVRNTGTPQTAHNNMKSITADFHIYENSRLGIKIEYPSDWKVDEEGYHLRRSDEKQTQVVGFTSTRTGDAYSKLENVALYVKNLLSQNMTIDVYAKKQIRSIQSRVKESTPTTIAGAPAYKVLYRGMKGDMILEVLEAWIMKNDKLYTITCIAAPNDFSSYVSIFQKMIDSFEIHRVLPHDIQQSPMNDANIQSSNSGRIAIDSMNIQRTGRDYVVSGRIVNTGGSNSGAIRLKLRVTSVDTGENLYETTFTPSPNILGPNQYGDFSVPFSIKRVVDKFDYQVDFISE